MLFSSSFVHGVALGAHDEAGRGTLCSRGFMAEREWKNIPLKNANSAIPTVLPGCTPGVWASV